MKQGISAQESGLFSRSRCESSGPHLRLRRAGDPCCHVEHCVDRPPVLAGKLEAAAVLAAPASSHGPRGPSIAARLAMFRHYQWPNGTVIRIRFLGGDAQQRAMVKRHALGWIEFANLHFAFGDDRDAPVRIAFEEGGSWSFIGTDCTRHKAGPTMNFGWLRRDTSEAAARRVILHEFGHLLGFVHEHQNPARPFRWNREAVYRHYRGAPNHWSPAEVDHNVFRKYSRARTQFTDFDPRSIMCYPIPNEFTVGDYEVGLNYDLSEADRRFARMMYPRPAPRATTLYIGAPPHDAELGQPGEVDVYRFEVTMPGRYELRTGGGTDTVIALEKENRQLIAEDDNSGYDHNAAIRAVLEPGWYTIRVWHHNPRATGRYAIWLMHSVRPS